MQFLIFSIVGIIGTGAHYAVLIILVRAAGADAVLASMAGYVTGAVVNYWLNYHVTFNSDQRHLDAIWKFFAVAAVGFMLNTLLMVLATKVLAIHYLLSQVAATGAVLLWNYWGNRIWTFRPGDHEQLQHK